MDRLSPNVYRCLCPNSMAWPSFWLIDTSRTIRPESTTTAVFVCYFKLKSSYPWREYAFATPQTASAVIVAKTTAVHAASSACCPWFCEAWRRRAMEIDFNSSFLAQDDVSNQGMWPNQDDVMRFMLMDSLLDGIICTLSSFYCCLGGLFVNLKCQSIYIP